MNQELYQITVGAVLKWNRVYQEITLAQASKISGLSLQYIGELERGEKNPSESSIDVLCDAYHIEFERTSSSEENGIQKINKFIHYLNFLSVDKLVDINYMRDEHSFSLSFLYDQLIKEAYLLFIKNDTSEFSLFYKILSKFYERTDGLLYSFYNYVLSLYYDICDNEKALLYAERSISNFDIAEAYFRANYSALLFKYNHLIQALKESEKAIIISQNNSYFKLIQLTRMNQALIFMKMRRYDESIKELNECLKNAEANNIKDIVMKCKANIVYVYLLDHKLDKAKEYCDKWFHKSSFSYQLTSMILSYYSNENYKSDFTEIMKLYKAMKEVQLSLDSNKIDKYIKDFEIDFISLQLFFNAVIYNLELTGNYALENKYLKQLFGFTQF